jgi:hypothetical protein
LHLAVLQNTSDNPSMTPFRVFGHLRVWWGDNDWILDLFLEDLRHLTPFDGT